MNFVNKLFTGLSVQEKVIGPVIVKYTLLIIDISECGKSWLPHKSSWVQWPSTEEPYQ